MTGKGKSGEDATRGLCLNHLHYREKQKGQALIWISPDGSIGEDFGWPTKGLRMR